jgi:hypothetical protein
MPRLPDNIPLCSASGRQLSGLIQINSLDSVEKEEIYRGLVPLRLLQILAIPPGGDSSGRMKIIAPEGMSLARVEVREHPDDSRTVFFLDIAETHYHQMELSFCIINDPFAPRFAVDLDEKGNDNAFTTLGRNVHEEIRAMRAGLFPNQTSRGLRMFGEFFEQFERFVDSLCMDIILAEPLTYDNSVRYEKYGFDYLNGRRMMMEIDRAFRPGGVLFNKLDGSGPFRMPGMDRTVHGRSWAIHDGILGEPLEDIRIYKAIGINAGVNTFPDREWR